MAPSKNSQVPMSFFGWPLYQPDRAPVDNTWRKEQLRFIAQEDNPNGGFLFILNEWSYGFIAVPGGELPGNIWLSGLRFYESNFGKPVAREMIPASAIDSAANKIPENWAIKSEPGSKAKAGWVYDPKTGYDRRGSLCLTVDTNPREAWLRLEVTGYPLKKGREYTVELALKASISGYMKFFPLLFPGRSFHGDENLIFSYPARSNFERQSRMASDVGVHDYQIVFTVPPLDDPSYEEYFKGLNRAMELITKADNQAQVNIRIGCQPPLWWFGKYPQELETISNGVTRYPAPSSLLWQDYVRTGLAAAVKRIERDWGSVVSTYFPSAMETGEWFYPVWNWDGAMPGSGEVTRKGFIRWLQAKYQSPQALSASWGISVASFADVQLPTAAERKLGHLGEFYHPKQDQNKIDFVEFYNDAMADGVILCAKVIKEACNRKKKVMAFHGYLHELSGAPSGLNHSGHLKLSRLLNCPDLDMIASPYGYGDRELGGIGAFHGPVDAYAAYGKQYYGEDDTTTHRCPAAPPNYRWCNDIKQTQSMHTRNFAQNYSRGFGSWYMDLIDGGWLLDTDIWANIGKLHRYWQEHPVQLDKYRPEIVMLVDERSPLYTRPDSKVLGHLHGKEIKWPVASIGAPVGWSTLQAFLDGKVPAAKMYVFASSFALSKRERAKIQATLANQKATAVWLYAPGYIDIEDRLASEANMKELTGFDFAAEPACTDILMPSGNSQLAAGYTKEFGSMEPSLAQHWHVDAGGMIPMAQYPASGHTGMAALDATPDRPWRSVYVGSLNVPTALLRNIAKWSGVHIHNDTDDIIIGNGDFLCLHAASDGNKTIMLKHKAMVYDCISGKPVGKTASAKIEVKIKKGETRIFRLNDR
ncbi:MAG: hypothetical protein ACYC1M_07500 [Armatimonadota bacterium]